MYMNEQLKNELLSLQKNVNDLVEKYIIQEENHINEVCQEYLSVGDIKILISIPTETKLEDKLPSDLSKLSIPSGCQVKYLNVHSLPTHDAYNYSIKQLLEDGADYLFCVEDDTYVQPDTLYRLLKILRDRKDIHAIGAWYPKRDVLKEGVHIVIGKDGKREACPRDAGLIECYTLAQGATLFKSEIFKYVTPPYFMISDNLTQDSFFSQKARKMGYRLFCDTSIKCKHIDRVTGEVFE